MTVPNKIFNVQGFARLGAAYSEGSLIEYKPETTINETSLDPGLDQMVRGEITYHAGYWGRNIDPALDHSHLNWGILPDLGHAYAMPEVAAGAHSSGIMHLRSYASGVGTWLNSRQTNLVDDGLYMEMLNYDPQAPNQNGEHVYYTGFISSLKIFFLNPIVNSISRLWAPTAGGVAVVLTGLGFDNTDSELDIGGPAKPDGWTDKVDTIDFIGLQGKSGSWIDDFCDGIRKPAWIDQPNNGTIVEASDVLTLAIANGIHGDFWGATKDNPICWFTPGEETVTVIAKLNSYTVNNLTIAGIYITDVVAGTNGIHFGRTRNDGTGEDGLQVTDMGTGALAYVAVTTLPIWLRVTITGSGAGSTMVFDYSTNGTDWTNLHTQNNETWDKIGLAAWNWAVWNPISAPFEFFKYSYTDIPSVTLNRILGDFTVDSNTQITIPANKFPALSAGSYHINLKKINVNLDAPTDITGYAGDWACDSDGKVFLSTRISFFISDTYVDRPFRTRKAPKLLTDWHLKDKSDGSEVMKYYAMHTVRCPDRVYKGNLSNISSIPRGFEDKTGLFKVSDLTLDLANNDKEFSKLLAGNTILKNQIVKLYQAYPDEPFGWRSHIISLIIDDYFFEDNIFKVKLKDITQKYFRLIVPRAICKAEYTVEGTAFTYPNIHPDSIGAFVPEVLGLCSLTTGEFRGQIEALCIDTTIFKYVAANGALKEITEVYADDIVAVDTANYTVTREDDGRTYITFTSDQGDKKVTYNAKGYIYAGLNSDNGYIQNPAYILLYFLLIILKIPPTLIDYASFVSAATIFDNMGEAEAGKLILQDEQKPMDVTQDLMAGAKCYPRKDGRLALGFKDISNYSTNNGETAPIIFRQLDIVGKFDRKYNLRDAITMINAEYDYVPTWDLFKSNVSKKGDVTIDPWDPVEIEDILIARTPGRRGGGRRKERAWAR